MGGCKREIKVEEDDVYGWWLLGLDMIASQQLSGIKLTRKAVKIMADKHDEMLKETD